MNINFAYSTGKDLVECSVKDISELEKYIQQLSIPKASLYLSPPNIKRGYLDFHTLDDGAIEMEIMEDNCVNEFAAVDVPMVSKVVKIAWSDNSNLQLRQKLNDLPIKWLT